MVLEISGLTKCYENHPIFQNLNLFVEKGEMVVLLGASGVGKTTLLRLIAGLEPVDQGSIKINGKLVNNIPSSKRGIGMMFQDLGLFPHMDVFSNIAFGLRTKKEMKVNIHNRVDELLSMLQLEGYGNRNVNQLSGGEMQRVALERALAPYPAILLLDEPLGSLDRPLRDILQDQIRLLLKDLNITVLYVTHDRDEAFVVADKIAFVDNKRIIQIGTSMDVYNNPKYASVAKLLGFKNILKGKLIHKEDDNLIFQTQIGDIFVKNLKGTDMIKNSMDSKLYIDSSGIKILDIRNSSDQNTFIAKIRDIRFKGDYNEIVLKISGYEIFARIPICEQRSYINIGNIVGVKIDSKGVRVFSDL